MQLKAPINLEMHQVAKEFNTELIDLGVVQDIEDGQKSFISSPMFVVEKPH